MSFYPYGFQRCSNRSESDLHDFRKIVFKHGVRLLASLISRVSLVGE